MTATAIVRPHQLPHQQQQQQHQHSEEVSCIKAVCDKEMAKARRTSFGRLRSLSNSFTKTRRGSGSSASASASASGVGSPALTKSVSFNLEDTQVHALPEIDEETRAKLYLTYQDKVSIADDVEETCYRFNDSDWVHPFVQLLDQTWEKSATTNGRALSHEQDSVDFEKLVAGKGRGLEKKLIADMKRNREQVVKTVLDTQKSYKNLPVGQDQRAKILRNKYKKLTHQSKVFALAMAQGDAQLAATFYDGNKVVATSA